MTEKIHTPNEKGWLEQTDWCGDFQPALLGAPRTFDETSKETTEVVQGETTQTLGCSDIQGVTTDKTHAVLSEKPDGKNIPRAIVDIWNESILGRLFDRFRGR